MNGYTVDTFNEVFRRTEEIRAELKQLEIRANVLQNQVDAPGTFLTRRGPRGLYIPFYIYPTDPYNNVDIATVRSVALQMRGIASVVVVVNPAGGPGAGVDTNYRDAIRLFRGAGCFVLGYVATDYGKKDEVLVYNDIDTWNDLYPEIDGFFLDEAPDDPDPAKVTRFKQYYGKIRANNEAHYVDINPGMVAPNLLQYQGEMFDIAVTWENSAYPTETDALGNGAEAYDPRYRCALVHTQPSYNDAAFVQLYTWYGFVYVTNDDGSANPWDSLSVYMNQMRLALSLVDDGVDLEPRIGANETTLGDHETRIGDNEATLGDHDTRIDANDPTLDGVRYSPSIEKIQANGHRCVEFVLAPVRIDGSVENREEHYIPELDNFTGYVSIWFDWYAGEEQGNGDLVGSSGVRTWFGIFDNGNRVAGDTHTGNIGFAGHSFVNFGYFGDRVFHSVGNEMSIFTKCWSRARVTVQFFTP